MYQHPPSLPRLDPRQLPNPLENGDETACRKQLSVQVPLTRGRDPAVNKRWRAGAHFRVPAGDIRHPEEPQGTPSLGAGNRRGQAGRTLHSDLATP